MIQEFLKNELEKVIPELEWTTDFYTAKDNTGTVYNESGRQPEIYETGTLYPSYMVYIRSSEWSFAESAANKVFETLHKKAGFTATANEYDQNGNVIDTKFFRVFFIVATSNPIRVGVQDNVMEYSVNFDVTMTEIKN